MNGYVVALCTGHSISYAIVIIYRARTVVEKMFIFGYLLSNVENKCPKVVGVKNGLCDDSLSFVATFYCLFMHCTYVHIL